MNAAPDATRIKPPASCAWWQEALFSRLSPAADFTLALALLAAAALSALRGGPLNANGIAIFALFDALCLLLAASSPPTVQIDFALTAVLVSVLALEPGGALAALFGGVLGAALVIVALRRERPSGALPFACSLRSLVRALSVYAVGALAAGAVYRLVGGTLPLALADGTPALGRLFLAGAALTLGVIALLGLILALARQAGGFPAVSARRLLVMAIVSLITALLVAWAYSLHADQPWNAALLIAVIGAVLALALAAARTRAALEQRMRELAALNRVGAIVTAHPDAGSLFDVIYRQIEQFCDVPVFSIALADATQGRVTFPYVCDHGRVVEWPDQPLGGDLTAHVIQTRRSLLLDGDLAAGARSLGIDLPDPPPACYLGVPMMAGDAVIGVIAAQHDADPRAYGRFERELLEAIAVQARVAVRNERLFGEAQTVSAELQELVASSREFGATLDISALAASAVRRLHRASSARAVTLFEWNPENNTLHPLAHFPPDAGDLPQRLLDAHHTALVASLGSQDPIAVAVHGGSAASDGGAEHRAFAVPLVARERPVGLAVLWDQPDQAGPPGTRRLVEGMIHQAAVALQNAQTYSRADASLRERVIELSAIEVISRHMSATLDHETIINDVVAAAMSAIDAALGCCALVLDDERFMVVAMLDQSGAQVELPLIGHISQGMTGRVLREHRPVVVGDVLAEPAYLPLFDGMRSELCVPIMREGRPIGLLNFEDPRANAFTESHMRFVSTLAEHAAIALENARLFTDRRRQIETLVSLRRISTQLLAAAQLEPIGEMILRYVQQTLHAERAALYWVTEGKGSGDANSEVSGVQLACADGADSPPPDAIVRRVVESGQPYYSVDVSALPVYQAFMPLRDFAARACVPIRRGDSVLGVLDVVMTDTHYYTANEVQALEVIATQAAVAVESARLNEAVRAGRDQLQTILDSTREGMLLFDLDGRLLKANRAAEEMLGQPLAPAQGRSYLEWLRGQLPARVQALTGLTLAEVHRYVLDMLHDPRRTLRRQFMQQRESGTRYIDEIGLPVLDERGENVIGWMLVWRDITEERKLDDLRQELSSMIVHDLRSPLTAIISSLTLLDDLLVEEPLDRKAMQEVASIAAASGESMLRLVESLLDIARLEQNRMSLDLAAYRLRDIVDSAYASVLSLALEAGITIETRLPDDLPLVWIDGGQIHRVLVNLLDNALRYTPAGGRVSVEAGLTEDGEAVRVSICDSGPGIPPDERSTIFEKFTQLDHPVLRGHRGSGLGLSFCKLVVEAHGGRIWVDDAALGGAAFHFTLRPADSRAPQAPTTPLDGHDIFQDASV